MNQVIETLKKHALLIIPIVIVVALLAVNIVFYMGMNSVKAEQSDLKKARTSADNNLTVATAQYDLNTLRAQQAELSGGANFPATVSVVELGLFLASAAESSGVSIDSVTSAAGATETIGTKKYPRVAVTLQVSASSYSKINTFLITLENGPFDTLKVQSLSLTQTSGKFEVSVVTQP